jgi:hypothetical protein
VGRRYSRREKALVLALYLGISASIFHWIPGRNVVLAADYLRLVPPWKTPGATVHNPTLTDALWVFYPWQKQLHDAVLHGRFPLWDPSIQAGVPVAANPISALFFPLTWLSVLLGPKAGMSLAALLRPALAAFFLYLYLRRAGRSALGAAFGGLTFGFSLPFLVWAEHPQDNVFLLAPVLLLCLDRAILEGRGAFSLALVGALILLGGHPESAVHLALLGLAYVIVQAGRFPVRARSGAPRVLAGAAGALGLSAFALYPAALVVLRSAAWSSGEHAAFALPPKALLLFFFPDFYGNPAHGRPVVAIPGGFAESACFAGLLAIALALFAFGVRRRRIPPPVFWAGVIAVSLAAIYVVPLAPAFSAVPILGKTFHTRLSILVAMALGVLASAGLDRLRNSHVLRKNAFAAGIAVTALQALDLWRAGAGYHTVVDPALVYPPSPLVAAAARESSGGRLFAFGATLPPNAASVYGLKDVRGYDAIESAAYRAARLPLARWSGNPGLPPMTATGPTPATRSLLPQFGVAAILLPPGVRLTADAAGPQGLNLQLVASTSEGVLYRVAGSSGRLQPIETASALVQWRDDSPEHLAIATRSSAPFGLRIADSYDPAWRATLDGSPLSIDRIDGAFREVRVPAGDHVLEMRYRLPGMPATLLLAAATAGLLVLLSARGKTRRERAVENR